MLSTSASCCAAVHSHTSDPASWTGLQRAMLFAPGRPRALELWRRSGVDWGEDREPDGAPAARRVWVETEPRKVRPDILPHATLPREGVRRCKIQHATKQSEARWRTSMG